MTHHLLPVLRLLGWLMACFALTMTLPLAAALYYDDGMAPAFMLGMALTLGCGLLLGLGLSRYKRELQPRHALLLVVSTWTLLPLAASIPLMQGLAEVGRHLTMAQAYYEASSGLSTAGGTVLSGLDGLPTSINVWRCYLQWLGGLGILILVVAVLPMLGVGGSQLYRAEIAGPLKEGKLTPRVAQTATGLWAVYATLSTACALAYWAAGMSPLDALLHMFTTVSLGGLSSHDASIGYFNSAAVEWVAVAFMFISAGNFALYFTAVQRRRWLAPLANPEWRATMLTLAGCGAFMAVWVAASSPEGGDTLTLMRHGFFHTISIATTTGYSTTDYEVWPLFGPVLILLLSTFATSAGSAGGGIKMIRLLVLLKQTAHELNRMTHPHAVRPVRIGHMPISGQTVLAVLAFVVVYGVTTLTLALLLLLTGMDPLSAATAAWASVNCVGPGLGEVGPARNFAGLTDIQLWLCSLGMVMGRLEFLSFVALLLPSFWRR
ncbi:MAG: TrkH family potassium uptake protein [Proteobacteria bacterium]|nr:TrkH family potassium uptake protein [Pseudomonadota bacterium]